MFHYLQKKIKCQNDTCQCCKLLSLCLLKDFKDDELNNISKLIDGHYILPAGKIFCYAGENFDYLYMIKSGSAKDTMISMSGNEQITDFYFPGEIIGLDAISTGKYAFNTVTLEPSVICIIPFEALLILAQKMPSLNSRLMHLISQKLLNRTHFMMNNHHTAEQRLAAFLINMADRYKCSGLPSKNYQLSMSRHDIGSYLNLTPETVSRIFTRFQAAGILIVHKKYIKLTNITQLIMKSHF